MSMYDDIKDKILERISPNGGDLVRECVGAFALTNEGVTVGELKEFLASMPDELEVICNYSEAEETLTLEVYNDNYVEW